MNGPMLLQVAVSLAVLVALAVPVGGYLARVFAGEARLAQRLLGPLERALYRLSGVDPAEEMSWKRYACAVLGFNALGIALLYLLQRAQGLARLPLDPTQRGPVEHGVALNTALSFVTNTNWQAYGGETTMSHLTQMLGLTAQNFLSAATGLAVMVAILRGFSRAESKTLGSFWVDLVRGTLYVLLPLSLAYAMLLLWQGVPQTFAGAATVSTLEGHGATQTLSLGPVASQLAIKQLGTNGGGFFNANSAHPFEAPTPLANLLHTTALLLLPVAQCFGFGALVKDRRQGFAFLFAMAALLLPMLALCLWSEQRGNPALASLGVDQAFGALQGGGNMEGKEVRFGTTGSALYAVFTTAASNGSVNAMHDSFTPLGGLVPLLLMQLGEVVFGGVGSGLYGMLAFALIAVFLAGLMVGRTPEYLGKKVEAFEMKMASLVVLLPAAAVLLCTALACATTAGTAPLGNPGPHGFSEMLYAFSSAANNNGSAFGGLTVSSRFYTLTTDLCMLVGRYGVLLPLLAAAGSLAAKKSLPPSAGTLPTHTPLFVVLLAGTVLLVGALTFLPALALGPLVEHVTLSAR